MLGRQIDQLADTFGLLQLLGVARSNLGPAGRPQVRLARAGACRPAVEVLAVEDQLGVAVLWIQTPDADVFELHDHRRAGVELEGQQPFARGALAVLRIARRRQTVVVEQFHRLIAVEEVLEVVALADDVVFVPILFLVVTVRDELLLIVDPAANDLLAGLIDHHQIAHVDQPGTPALVVQKAHRTGIVLHLGLIAADPPFVELLAAVLHAGIAAENPKLQVQVKIAERAAAIDQERVASRGVLGRRLASDDPILDRPQAEIAIPGAEALAVEQIVPFADTEVRGGPMEPVHTAGDLWYAIVPVVLVFDGEHAVELLQGQFRQDGAGLAGARAPDHVVGAAVAELVEVLEVQAANPAGPAELLDRFDRIDPRTGPVPGVGAGADPLAATLADLHHGVGVPVVRGIRVIVDRYADLVLLAEPVDQSDGVLRRLGHDRLDAHVAREIEHLAALALVVRQAHHAVVDQLEPLLLEHLQDLEPQLGRHVVIERSVTVLLADLLAGIGFDVLQSHRFGLGHRFVEREAIEAVRLRPEAPLLLRLRPGHAGDADARPCHQQSDPHSHSFAHLTFS